ncbi:DEKNAAC102089 [Brettanomyces naardenensis]|uniref:Peptide hydrolase n=1 Tax=Brettanomyces naardenensis TaxID=13370 RepID=A0A448YJN3_BRENA|nr:DEKNAAC102089 [Brettanomyces naardenensis]
MKLSLSLLLLSSLSTASPIFNINWEKLGQEVLSNSPAPPLPDRPVVDSESLQDLIVEDSLRSRAESLYAIAGTSNKTFGHPTRVIGSKGHWKTIGYIKKEIKKLGHYYNVTTQPFEAFYGDVFYYNSTINGTYLTGLDPMDMSPPTPGKKPVSGPLLAVANYGCSLEDYPSNSAGSILLIQRGNCSFGDKSINAGTLGAKAAIIYNNEAGHIRGTLGVPPKGTPVVPSVGLSRGQGEHYLGLLSSGIPLQASVVVDSFVGIVHTLNVIAETLEGDPNNIVMLGAHSDSVAAGPGINDDGSGTISLLEVAKQLTKFKVNNKVRFAWWAAEEEGLLGSNYYARTLSPEENSKIRVFMDYDMMASPNYEYEVYDANNKENPKGSEELKYLYIDYYTDHGLNYTLIPFDGRSDYVGFIDHNIPAGGIAAGAEKKNVFNGRVLDRCYHQYCDNLDNLAYDAFIVNTKLIAHSVATYAKSFEGFPERDALTVASVPSAFKYRGSHLII